MQVIHPAESIKSGYLAAITPYKYAKIRLLRPDTARGHDHVKHLSTLISIIALTIALGAWFKKPLPAPPKVSLDPSSPDWSCARVAARTGRPNQTDEIHTALETCAALVEDGGQQVMVVEPGVRWDVEALRSRPAQVSILDLAGYDAKRAADVAQIRWLLHTTQPEKKNAHELIVQADHHPALVIDNVDRSDKLSRASVILRRNGGLLWRIGAGHRDDDTDFVIARGPGLASALNIDQDGQSMHFGPSAPTGVDYSFANADEGDMLVRYLNQDDGALRLQLQVKDSERKLQRPKTFLHVDAQGRATLSGQTLPIVRAPKRTVLATHQSGSLVRIARNIETIDLPAATPGVYFEFSVAAGARLPLNAAAGERIDGYESASNSVYARAALLRLVAVQEGIWHLQSTP